MSIGKHIVERIRQGGFSPLELEYNPALNGFIEQIVHEQKIAWVKKFDNGDPEYADWDAALFMPAETDLLAEDVEAIVKQLLGEENETRMSSTHFARVNSERAIPGMTPKIERIVGDFNIVHFFPKFPEYDYIYNQILDPNFFSYHSMIDKVLIPYIDFLETTDIDSGKNLPFEVPENIRKGMEEVFNEAGERNPIGDMNKDAMIDYTLYNVLQLANSREMRGALNNLRNERAKHGGDMTPEEEKVVIENIFGKVISKHDTPMKKLEGVLNGISSQLYMNTLEERDFSRVGIIDKVKRAFKLYTKHEKGDKTFETDEQGYRTVNVGIGMRDILLHIRGNNISRAMDGLGIEMAEIMKNSESFSPEEYTRHVARLHFRYIAIHPFRDSNGRIARNIANMMLNKIGRNFVVKKEAKSNYLAAMENMRQGIYSEMGQEEYLRALSDDPRKLLPCEARHCEGLAQLIEKSNTMPIRRKITRADKSAVEQSVPKAGIEF